jgi:hypothetical protein
VIDGADHGLSEERWQRSYTALLVSWMTEMVLGARQGSNITQTTTMPGNTMPEAPPTPA